MKPTPLERFFGSLYWGGMVALGITFLGTILYSVGGFLLLQNDMLRLSYPFLAVSQDPVLLFLVSAGGLFITVAMVGLIFYVQLNPGPEQDVFIVVILGSIAVGMGVSAFYYSLMILVKLVR